MADNIQRGALPCLQGYANIVGALFNCYTTTGSFSRSAVNNSCGAQSRAYLLWLLISLFHFTAHVAECLFIETGDICMSLAPAKGNHLKRLCGSIAEISSLVTGIFVMIVLLCLTKVFLYMPNNAQGAIIISGVVTLFDYK